MPVYHKPACLSPLIAIFLFSQPSSLFSFSFMSISRFSFYFLFDAMLFSHAMPLPAMPAFAAAFLARLLLFFFFSFLSLFAVFLHFHFYFCLFIVTSFSYFHLSPFCFSFSFSQFLPLMRFFPLPDRPPPPPASRFKMQKCKNANETPFSNAVPLPPVKVVCPLSSILPGGGIHVNACPASSPPLRVPSSSIIINIIIIIIAWIEAAEMD